MLGLEPPALKLLDAVTDAKNKSISFDLEIRADCVKYSGWISALAAAGLGILISNLDNIVIVSSINRWMGYIPAVESALFFIGSLALGGLLHWKSIASFEFKRQLMTLVLKQYCTVLNNEFNDKLEFRRLVKLDYLSSGDKEKYDEINEKDNDSPDEEPFLLAQSALVALGFVVALVGALLTLSGQGAATTINPR